MKYYDIATEKRAEFDIAMANFTKRMVKYFCCLLFCSILHHGVCFLTRQNNLQESGEFDDSDLGDDSEFDG